MLSFNGNYDISKGISEQPKAGVDVIASWYGAKHHNKTTSSGQRYDMHKKTVAHNTLPFGTMVKLVNPQNGKVAEGVVNDRGPYTKGRDIDASYALAIKLGFEKKGLPN
jgi:rare lipoprotein A